MVALGGGVVEGDMDYVVRIIRDMLLKAVDGVS
jgi:hypothetical protein